MIFFVFDNIKNNIDNNHYPFSSHHLFLINKNTEQQKINKNKCFFIFLLGFCFFFDLTFTQNKYIAHRSSNKMRKIEFKDPN
jgi:hypothetical protein